MTVERILFPDAAGAVIGALVAQLPSFGYTVPVRSKVPNPRPARFVVVFRTGGARANLVTDAAQLTIEAWSVDSIEAHDLAQAARAIINGLEGSVTGGVTFYAVIEAGGPADLPDPVSTQARFTWSTVVNVRGIAA